jgi:hypothetical protein
VVLIPLHTVVNIPLPCDTTEPTFLIGSCFTYNFSRTLYSSSTVVKLVSSIFQIEYEPKPLARAFSRFEEKLYSHFIH